EVPLLAGRPAGPMVPPRRSLPDRGKGHRRHREPQGDPAPALVPVAPPATNSHREALQMSMATPFLERNLRIAPIDVYIDPPEPQARAIVTHGHADHARYGHGA